MVAWHDLEHSGYVSDLEFWLRLVTPTGIKRVVELGAGSGRVVRWLASNAECVMTAVDTRPELLRALRARTQPGVSIQTVQALLPECPKLPGQDAILAPALFLQLMRDENSVGRMLEWVAGSLRPGGTFAATIQPSLRAINGRVLERLPSDRMVLAGRALESRIVAVDTIDRGVLITRQRLIDDRPAAEVSERLIRLDPATVAALAADRGLVLKGHELIPTSGRHAGVSLFTFHAI